ncbi:hypothetical protein QJS10_CPB15g01971 [Acorus calamus]|uniref:Uncharacterized protein n=1 Tax=Acorus calamus TaxID=4465 RepID=A0AAV9DB85_ACOCL|nr:hypothetical protein QJS10_CPB15g01971 [Acorus calamus]
MAYPPSAAPSGSPLNVADKWFGGEWPELVGKSWKLAKAVIELEDPYVRVFPVPEGNYIIEDIRDDRVWLWYDPKSLLVTRVPHIG